MPCYSPKWGLTCRSVGSGRPPCASSACFSSTPTLAAISLQGDGMTRMNYYSACARGSLTVRCLQHSSCPGVQLNVAPPKRPTHWSALSRALSTLPHAAQLSICTGASGQAFATAIPDGLTQQASNAHTRSRNAILRIIKPDLEGVLQQAAIQQHQRPVQHEACAG